MSMRMDVQVGNDGEPKRITGQTISSAIIDIAPLPRGSLNLFNIGDVAKEAR
ncbi:hypothetical protein F5887DRAFT_1121110 [Amanita rubescens]|nr:hypothetical protein F5887DRAFT_1121802 [Amanita rubescens]KAF8313172.1 hypothetical protein F5887DRAFT_1121110 [Amanita rubescens]